MNDKIIRASIAPLGWGLSASHRGFTQLDKQRGKISRVEYLQTKHALSSIIPTREKDAIMKEIRSRNLTTMD